MGNNFRCNIYNSLQIFPISRKVRNKRFHSSSWRLVSYCFYCLNPDFRSSVFQIIPIYGCNNSVFDSHRFHTMRNFSWFKVVHFLRSASFYGAKATRSRADVAKDHKCCSSFTPTFSHIWTTTAFANRMKFVFIH